MGRDRGLLYDPNFGSSKGIEIKFRKSTCVSWIQDFQMQDGLSAVLKQMKLSGASKLILQDTLQCHKAIIETLIKASFYGLSEILNPV